MCYRRLSGWLVLLDSLQNLSGLLERQQQFKVEFRQIQFVPWVAGNLESVLSFIMFTPNQPVHSLSLFLARENFRAQGYGK